jgi:hypothetical protein
MSFMFEFAKRRLRPIRSHKPSLMTLLSRLGGLPCLLDMYKQIDEVGSTAVIVLDNHPLLTFDPHICAACAYRKKDTQKSGHFFEFGSCWKYSPSYPASLSDWYPSEHEAVVPTLTWFQGYIRRTVDELVIKIQFHFRPSLNSCGLLNGTCMLREFEFAFAFHV